MPRKKTQPKRLKTKSTALRELEPLPPCDGPKLAVFPYHKSRVQWLERLDSRNGYGSDNEGEGAVFKVRIKRQLYAIKVFKFFNPDDSIYYWGPLLGKTPSAKEQVTYHTDPFYRECRAYGKLAKSSKKLVIPCLGYILFKGRDRKELQDVLFNANVDLDEDCLDDENDPWLLNGLPQPPPIRGIVKELASQDSGVDEAALKSILADIKAINKLKVYNRDIHEDNFKDGKLVDFGSSWTEPHCYMQETRNLSFIAQETRLGDLVLFDNMVEDLGIETSMRAAKLKPRKNNSAYRSKLRSHRKGKDHVFHKL